MVSARGGDYHVEEIHIWGEDCWNVTISGLKMVSVRGEDYYVEETHIGERDYWNTSVRWSEGIEYAITRPSKL